MNELVRALKDFIIRDIIYIIGGVSVIISFLYACGKVCIIKENSSTAFYLYFAGISYVIGWLIQEVFSIVHAVTTSMSYRPKWCIIKQLYRCYMRDGCPEVKQFDQVEYSILINQKGSEKNNAELERIVGFMQIGTTIGPCALVVGIILLAHKLSPTCTNPPLPELFSIGIIIMGIILMLLARIKVLQLVEFTYQLYTYLNSLQESEGITNTKS